MSSILNCEVIEMWSKIWQPGLTPPGISSGHVKLRLCNRCLFCCAGIILLARGACSLCAFSFVGLRSVCQQRQSCRSTGLYLTGRTQIMSLCCFSELYHMCLACGFDLRRLCFAFLVAECIWSRGEVHVLVFLRARSCVAHELLFDGFLSTSSDMASVGGRRRKSAEEQCAEFQALARQTNLKTLQERVRKHHVKRALRRIFTQPQR